jgi:hypothetical protein
VPSRKRCSHPVDGIPPSVHLLQSYTHPCRSGINTMTHW